MKWFLCVAVLVGLVGCSKQTDEPVQPESSSVVAMQIAPPPMPVLTQQVITDENGIQRTITVPVQAVTPVAAQRIPTEGSVRNDLDRLLKEMMQVLDKATDMQTAQVCKSLLQRVRAVGERLNGSNPDFAHEHEEIRQIRAALAKCR